MLGPRAQKKQTLERLKNSIRYFVYLWVFIEEPFSFMTIPVRRIFSNQVIFSMYRFPV